MHEDDLLELKKQLETAIESGTPEAYAELARHLANMLAQLEAGHETSSSKREDLSLAIEAMKNTWFKGALPPEQLPGGPDQQAELSRLLSDMLILQSFAYSISRGDLSQLMKMKGMIAGSLKALQAGLRHLTWQTQMIAKGDFSQKVDFMGEFSEAFNSMVVSLEEAQEGLKQANSRLEQLAAIDGLTQVANRRYFDDYLNREWRRASREKTSISLIMIDIDYFKLFNDTYGHQAGDGCLQTVARIVSGSVFRPSDLVARYGGEEFAVVLPNTKSDDAMYITERIRVAVQEAKIVHTASTVSPYVTLSLGFSSIVPENDMIPSLIISFADKALYQAKEQGRNRAVLNTEIH